MTDLLGEELWYGAPDPAEARAEEDAAKSVAAQVGRILGAKPFPIAATKLAELTRDEKTPLHRVVDVLETDPALSARLLRLVNSAGYALRTACTSVGHAAALVGTEKLNQVATTAAILDMYDSATPAAAQILEHATIVGALCRYVAVHLGLPPDELFTCGFLHDIGKLMLLDCEGERYLQVLARVGAEPDVVHVKERELFGYDHAILAGHVLAAWHIPEPVPQVVAWHHQAARAYEDPLIARMVAVVRFCDALSYCIFRPLPEPEIERLARSEACSYLEVSALQIGQMWADLHTLALKSRAGFRGELVPGDVEARSRGVKVASDPPANDNQVPAAANPAKAPTHFPCVVCGVPSYANQCPACHGYVCPGHQLGQDEWCYLCVDEFRRLELKFPRWVHLAMASVIALTAVMSIVGASAAAAPTTMKWLTAPGLGVACLAMLLFVWRRWLRRFWFLRTVANRAGFAPVVTDQVVQGITSLPPTSKRVVNPFDLRSLRPVAAVGLSSGVEYYSLAPSAPLDPLPLTDADSMEETLVLHASDELVDLELGEPLMALASLPPQVSAQRVTGSSERPDGSSFDDPFAPEPESTPPDDPFANDFETALADEGSNDRDSETAFTSDDDAADERADANEHSDSRSEQASDDARDDEDWGAGAEEAAPDADDHREASVAPGEADDDDDWSARAAEEDAAQEGSAQEGSAQEDAAQEDAAQEDTWHTGEGDALDEEDARHTGEGDALDEEDAWHAGEGDALDEEDAWHAGEGDALNEEDARHADADVNDETPGAANTADDDDTAFNDGTPDADDATNAGDTADEWTASELSADDPGTPPSDAGESAAATDVEADEDGAWADAADRPSVGDDAAEPSDESVPPSPAHEGPEVHAQLPTPDPSDQEAESKSAHVSADDPAPSSEQNAAAAPESADFMGSYTFRHPQAWRAIVESPGAADGW